MKIIDLEDRMIVAENITSIKIEGRQVVIFIPDERQECCWFASEQQAVACFDKMKHFLRSDLVDLFVITEQPGFLRTCLQ